jgi:hypothetical protein
MKKLLSDIPLKHKSFEPGMGGYADFGIKFFKRKKAKASIREGIPVEAWRQLNKQMLQNVEFFKAKSTKFWDGMLIGLVIGYIPYAWHMYI